MYIAWHSFCYIVSVEGSEEDINSPSLQKAVTMLTRKGGQADGSFLIRPNSRRPGYYALTLIYTQMPYHYEIVCEVSRCYTRWLSVR